MTKIAFVMEQALGHVTHHQNLARWVAEDASLQATWLPISEAGQDVWERLPGIRGNWSLKASLRARDALNAAGKSQSLRRAVSAYADHVSVRPRAGCGACPPWSPWTPRRSIMIRWGAEYGHLAGNDSWLERRKYQWNQRTFHAATALTTWCQWAKDSLVNDYGVPAGQSDRDSARRGHAEMELRRGAQSISLPERPRACCSSAATLRAKAAPLCWRRFGAGWSATARWTS